MTTREVERDTAGEPAAALSFTYRTLGLTLRSAFRLDELPAGLAAEAPSVAIVKGCVPDEWGLGAPNPFIRMTAGRQLLRWAPVGAFLIADDDRIIVDPLPGIDQRLVALPLLGPVMAVLLHRRGNMVLHASAVEVEGRAVVLLGDKGAGKSTLAGALVSSGHRLLTDDLVAISYSADDRPMVEAAAGQLKLFDESRAALSLQAGAVGDAALHPSIPKRRHRLPGAFRTDPAPLGLVLALGRGPALGLEWLQGGDALQALLRFSYVSRFGREGFWEAGMRRLFAQCADISQAAPVGYFVVPNGLDRLTEAVRAIESLVAEEPGGDRR